MEAYEMIENLATYSDSVKFAGFARIDTFDGASAIPKATPLGFSAGVYKTAAALGEGAEFRFVVGSSESAYVYAFAASQSKGDDEFYSPVQLFPQAGVSPLLNYSDSAVALPGEDKILVLDAVPGMEYLVVLYAKQALDMRAIMRGFVNADGTASERLAAAVGANLLTAGAVSYSENEAAFTAESNDGRAVSALILAIDHQ
jgi:hypothetical protein